MQVNAGILTRDANGKVTIVHTLDGERLPNGASVSSGRLPTTAYGDGLPSYGVPYSWADYYSAQRRMIV